jgi:pyruvate/2-oxoglutarate dehydrogenase complex dihydrolipoamide acyltransferase (E2) component
MSSTLPRSRRIRLTCDHRILYGADAAGFLRIKALLEQPLAMSL